MIVAPTGHRTGPCGACRSVIDEFADGDIPVMFGESINGRISLFFFKTAL